jgi:RNA polymerase sigma-70 factor (ECF subfamily)
MQVERSSAMSALSQPAAPSSRETAAALATREQSFTDFYDAHFAFVWRNIRRLVDVESAVDDLVQEVFVIVFRRFGDFEGRSSTKTWVFGILLNVVRAHRRTTKRRGARASADFDQFLDPAAGPEVSAEQEQARRALHEILAGLDDAKREVFVLAELEQMTAPQIAEVTGATVSAVYARLRAARIEFDAASENWRKPPSAERSVGLAKRRGSVASGEGGPG